MRIGLYGMPTSGKSFILEKIDFLDVLNGSQLLREYDPAFDTRDEKGREKDRIYIAGLCKNRDRFIMDGHYAFGDEIAFTEADGEVYDCFLYLYVSPEILRERMMTSTKNMKYLTYDLVEWQKKEIYGLRSYCHKHNKDFYVLDCPPKNEYVDTTDVILFLKDIINGYSNVNFARHVADEIISESTEKKIFLFDGDRTWIKEDSSNYLFGYKTILFDGNFYTGFQSWKQYREFNDYTISLCEELEVHRNPKVPDKFDGDAYIISSGNRDVWNIIASKYGMKVFVGNEMSSDTKYFVTKFLRESGKEVISFGDSMSDYYMLMESDQGFLITKADGRISRSLSGKDLGGIHIV